MMTPFVVALEKVHDVKSFNCGNDVLNNWLGSIARQHQDNSLSQTFVLVDADFPQVVLGYYALALRSMTPKEALPREIAKKLPRNLPGITLARLGVQQGEQGKHYGEYLLVDAMRRARAAALEVGGWSLFVDAKDDQAAGFYRKYGFIPLPSNPLVLFMSFANMPE